MQVGEVYRDKDKRMSSGNRYLLVVATNGGRRADKAVCVPCDPSGRRRYKDGTLTTTISDATLRKRFELQTGNGETKKPLPTIAEMSSLVHDFTNGKSMKDYMEELSNE